MPTTKYCKSQNNTILVAILDNMYCTVELFFFQGSRHHLSEFTHFCFKFPASVPSSSLKGSKNLGFVFATYVEFLSVCLFSSTQIQCWWFWRLIGACKDVSDREGGHYFAMWGPKCPTSHHQLVKREAAYLSIFSQVKIFLKKQTKQKQLSTNRKGFDSVFE